MKTHALVFVFQSNKPAEELKNPTLNFDGEPLKGVPILLNDLEDSPNDPTSQYFLGAWKHANNTKKQ